jgi:hypothetical protein
MNENVQNNRAAASKEVVAYWKRAYAAPWSVQKLVYADELGILSQQ